MNTTNGQTTMTIKFNRYHVTNGTTKASVFYSLDNRADGRKVVTIYARDYTGRLGKIIADAFHDNSDYQTDYVEKGTVRLFADHPLYAAARTRAEAIAAARKVSA